MYLLKHLPEDFVVEELASFALKEEGPFLLINVTKRDKNTEDVAKALAVKLRLPRKAIAYAGSKDRHAVTTQAFSIKGKKEEVLKGVKIEDLKIEFLGYLAEPLALGLLKGNRFTLTVRNLEGNESLTLPRFIPNYYDEQRFSSNNARIGEALIRKEFKAASEILKDDVRHAEKICEHLKRAPTDPLGALRHVPIPILRLYLHAFQSRLWNDILGRYIENNARGIKRIAYSQGSLCFPLLTDKLEDKMIPLPGFGFESDDSEIQQYLDDILKMNSLTQRDFVIKQLPNLSLEGDLRPALMRVENFSASDFEDDDQFPGKKKVTLTFELKKGSYATMLVKAIFVQAV